MAYPVPEVFEGHPSAEKKLRWPQDMRLRRNGFKIESRPRKGPNIWSLKGVMYFEVEALWFCDRIEEALKAGAT